MNKEKIIFGILFVASLIALFLPWSSLDSNTNVLSGFDFLIGRGIGGIFSSNPSWILSPFVILYSIIEGYIIGLVLLAIFFFVKSKKIFFWALLCMILGLIVDYFVLNFQSFGGDVSNTVSYGSGYWLAVWITLIYVAWGLKKIPFQSLGSKV